MFSREWSKIDNEIASVREKENRAEVKVLRKQEEVGSRAQVESLASCRAGWKFCSLWGRQSTSPMLGGWENRKVVTGNLVMTTF